ncbi:MAG: lipid II flippase MurJ, partial [Acidimicrobiia bacterium]
MRKGKPGLGRESIAAGAGSGVALLAGLALDLTLAFLLGAGAQTDALFVALRIPLAVAVFFTPAAIQVLIPTITGWLHEHDQRATNARISAVVVVTMALTGLITLVGIAVAPVLMTLIAPGLSDTYTQLAVDLSRIAFLVIPPIAVSEVLRAYRHARRSHGLASALHGTMALTILVILLAFAGSIGVRMAAWAYVVGATIQAAASWVLARRAGFAFASGGLYVKELKRLGSRVAGPLAGSGVQLGTRLGEQIFASFLAPGSITVLNLAHRLISAIGGSAFFRPLTTAFIAPMSQMFVSKDEGGMQALLRKGLRAVLFLSLFLMALVAIAGGPFIAGLFGRGNFGVEPARVLGIVVAVYSASLPTAALQRM